LTGQTRELISPGLTWNFPSVSVFIRRILGTSVRVILAHSDSLATSLSPMYDASARNFEIKKYR
jgi:hypothetical protein